MDVKLTIIGGKANKTHVALVLPTVIGRSREADLTIAHPMVSRQHCEVFENNGILKVRDLGSLNGTFVHRKQITSEAVLRPNDEFTIGPLTFRVEYKYEGDPAALERAVASQNQDTEIYEQETDELMEPTTMASGSKGRIPALSPPEDAPDSTMFRPVEGDVELEEELEVEPEPSPPPMPASRKKMDSGSSKATRPMPGKQPPGRSKPSEDEDVEFDLSGSSKGSGKGAGGNEEWAYDISGDSGVKSVAPEDVVFQPMDEGKPAKPAGKGKPPAGLPRKPAPAKNDEESSELADFDVEDPAPSKPAAGKKDASPKSAPKKADGKKAEDGDPDLEDFFRDFMEN